MSAKLLAVGVAVSLVASVGCSGVFVPKAQYERDLEQSQAYNKSLERDNAELHKYKEAYEALKRDSGFIDAQGKAYEEMAEALKKALAGLQFEPGEVIVKSDGTLVMGTDLAFESGSFDITPKGKEVLKRFAETVRGKELKVVGHTDRRPVVQAPTKARLHFDTNLELSSQRANAVATELGRNGIAMNSMGVEGRGSSAPIGSDKQNRRVEIYIVQPAGKVSKP